MINFCRAIAIFAVSLIALEQPLCADIKSEVKFEKKKYANRRLIVRYKNETPLKKIQKAHFSAGAHIINSFTIPENTDLVEISKGISIDAAIDFYREDPNVKYVEKDVVFHAIMAPPPVRAPTGDDGDPARNKNDPLLEQQWGLNNSGQTGGKAGVDINAFETWKRTTGDNDLVIGIIDTGIADHPDLRSNLWTNTLEIPGNNIDDDNNGVIDDIHGADFVEFDGDPTDDHGHGSHCAGIIGAEGDNKFGGRGVMKDVKIIACKFLDETGSGSASDAILCLNYFRDLSLRAQSPVKIFATSNSWGGAETSQALVDAIQEQQNLGILFFAAASNEGQNNDIVDIFPADIPLANIVSVSSIDHNGLMSSFSNFGKRSVHLSAPGEAILSTTIGNDYELMDGTSMAAPFAAGLAGLIKANNPDLNYIQVKNLLMAGGILEPGLVDLTISGRRIRGVDNNGLGSLSCKDQIVSGRLSPSWDRLVLPVGKSLILSAININCEKPNGELVIPLSPTNTFLTLQDKGQNKDSAANDGLYSQEWSSSTPGHFEFMFPNNDLVSIEVYDLSTMKEYKATNEIEFAYRKIEGTSLLASDDSLHSVDMPFPVMFGGGSTGFERLNVDANGALSLTDMHMIGFNNQAFPAEDLISVIAPFWDDLRPDSFGGNIYYETLGQAPHREFVVEWREVSHFASPDGITFQVVFFENSSDILFNYLDVDFGLEEINNGANATIGIQTSPEHNILVAHDTPQIQNNTAIRFSVAP
jgi:subtilisin family serine protease